MLWKWRKKDQKNARWTRKGGCKGVFLHRTASPPHPPKTFVFWSQKGIAFWNVFFIFFSECFRFLKFMKVFFNGLWMQHMFSNTGGEAKWMRHFFPLEKIHESFPQRTRQWMDVQNSGKKHENYCPEQKIDLHKISKKSSQKKPLLRNEKMDVPEKQGTENRWVKFRKKYKRRDDKKSVYQKQQNFVKK